MKRLNLALLTSLMSILILSQCNGEQSPWDMLCLVCIGISEFFSARTLLSSLMGLTSRNFSYKSRQTTWLTLLFSKLWFLSDICPLQCLTFLPYCHVWTLVNKIPLHNTQLANDSHFEQSQTGVTILEQFCLVTLISFPLCLLFCLVLVLVGFFPCRFDFS